MRFPEARTITAISTLRHSYPYAASLLSYVVVERVLKRYVLDHWKDASYGDWTIPSKIKRHGGKTTRELSRLNRKQRLAQVICRLTLGDVEDLLGRPHRELSASDRNEVMHSNLYLKEESKLSRARQQAKNDARLAKALEHLGRAMEQFTEYTLVESDGSLSAQPNTRLKLAGDPPSVW